MIDPVMGTGLTSGYISGPRANNIKPIKSSAALPKVALRSPPTPGPMPWPRFSVMRPMSPASGMIANPAAQKIQTFPACSSANVPATGNTKSSQ